VSIANLILHGDRAERRDANKLCEFDASGLHESFDNIVFGPILWRKRPIIRFIMLSSVAAADSRMNERWR